MRKGEVSNVMTTGSRAVELREHLVTSRLAGDVSTSVQNTRLKVGRLLDGNPECTFGLSDWETTTFEEVAAAIQLTSGASLTVDDESVGWIDPDATMAGIERYARAFAPYLATGGSSILLATGHPTGLLPHYMELGRALREAGNTLLSTHDDGPTITPQNGDHAARTVRFVGRVACVFDGLSLVHSHLSAYMEVMLDEFAAAGQQVDLVIGDHGMAGAAVERGIPAISIADVNDPGLPLAHARGRHPALLVIDDNLAPVLFEPVTEYILEIARREAGL